jgi:kynurenine formamidase
MKLIDVSLPLSPALPTYPGNTPFHLEPIQRISDGDEVASGVYELLCLPLAIVGGNGAPARVVLRRA